VVGVENIVVGGGKTIGGGCFVFNWDCFDIARLDI
jgi:hypothetical protein